MGRDFMPCGDSRPNLRQPMVGPNGDRPSTCRPFEGCIIIRGGCETCDKDESVHQATAIMQLEES